MAGNKEWKVKGTMLVDYVKIIRSRKDIPWEKYLTREDMDIVRQRIFPMGWYPFDFFRRAGLAILHEVANDDMEVVRQFGKITMKNLTEKTLTMLKDCNNVFDSFKRLNTIGDRFFNFATPRYEKEGEKSLRVTLMNVPDVEGVEAFCYQIIGNYEYMIEFYGGKNVKLDWDKKTWEGDKNTSFILSWE